MPPAGCLPASSEHPSHETPQLRQTKQNKTAPHSERVQLRRMSENYPPPGGEEKGGGPILVGRHRLGGSWRDRSLVGARAWLLFNWQSLDSVGKLTKPIWLFILPLSFLNLIVLENLFVRGEDFFPCSHSCADGGRFGIEISLPRTEWIQASRRRCPF